MPLVHIYLTEGKSDQQIKKIGDGIHEALMRAWDIPEPDRFHIIHEKKLHTGGAWFRSLIIMPSIMQHPKRWDGSWK